MPRSKEWLITNSFYLSIVLLILTDSDQTPWEHYQKARSFKDRMITTTLNSQNYIYNYSQKSLLSQLEMAIDTAYIRENGAM